MKTNFLAATLVFTAPPVSANKLHMKVARSADPTERVKIGVKTLESRGVSAVFSLTATSKRVKKRSEVKILAYDTTNAPFNISKKNIHAEIEDHTPVKVVPYMQIAAEERASVRRAALWA